MTTPAVYGVAYLLLLLFSFVVFRVIVRRAYRLRGRLAWWGTALEVLVFALYFCFPYIYNPPSWHAFWSSAGGTGVELRYLGAALMALGAVACLWFMAGLGFGRSLGQTDDTLRHSGAYGVTRNPQLVSFFLFVAGCVLLCPSAYALGWAALYGVISQMMIITEEEHMRRRHGDAFERYCEDTPRYIRLPWTRR